MKRHFIVVLINGFIQLNFADLQNDDRVTLLGTPYADNVHISFLKLLRKIHLSKRLNSFINLPFKGIWGTSLDKIKWSLDTEYYIVFVEPYPIPYTYLIELKRKYHVKYVLYASFAWHIDSYFMQMHKAYADKIGYDYIFSYDILDVQQYGFIYTDALFSKISITPSLIVNDLYLIANVGKGRLDELNKIYEFLVSKDISVKFYLNQVPRQQIVHKNIIYNHPIPYSQVLEEVGRSNCVLEVLAKNHVGATLRYYEAICYNKKLLTNNKNVVNLPFYNPDYIHVFEKPEDIDWEWVKERIPVDYHYDGRFSPTHLIDKIIELEEEKERKELGKVEAD